MPGAVGNISIYVKDTLNNPIISASVSFDTPYGVTRQTDYPDGKAVFFDVYAGTYSILVQKEGYVTYQGNITVAVGQQVFTVQLESSTPPTVSNVTITITGQGTTDKASAQYPLGSDLYITATPASGWHYVKMKRNSVDWTTANPGEFLNLAETENIECVFEEGSPPPGSSILILAVIGSIIGITLLYFILRKS